jgi:hypothetical protein
MAGQLFFKESGKRRGICCSDGDESARGLGTGVSRSHFLTSARAWPVEFKNSHGCASFVNDSSIIT